MRVDFYIMDCLVSKGLLCCAIILIVVIVILNYSWILLHQLVITYLLVHLFIICFLIFAAIWPSFSDHLSSFSDHLFPQFDHLFLIFAPPANVFDLSFRLHWQFWNWPIPIHLCGWKFVQKFLFSFSFSKCHK